MPDSSQQGHDAQESARNAPPAPAGGAEQEAWEAVLAFWFEQVGPKQWFVKDAAFDALVAQRFGALVEEALRGGLDHWNDAPAARLALILLLDQMTRNIRRDTPAAFAGDARALALSQQAVASGQLDAEADPARRNFLLMPLMHSEDLAVQDSAAPLFDKYADPETASYARRHREVIARFGRYPHRNAILGRVTTAEEARFLQQPGSSF